MSQRPQLGAGSGFVLPAEGETTLTWQNQSRQSYLLMTLGIVTPSFFSLLAKLVQFLPFPALRIHLGSQFIACGFLWWAGAVTGGNQVKKMIQVNTSFSAQLLLKKVQYVLVLEWLMRRGTMAQHRSVMLGGRQSYISWNSITSTPMDFSIAPSLSSTWQQMGLYWLSASQHVTRAFGTTASVRKPSCCLLLQNNTNNWL